MGLLSLFKRQPAAADRWEETPAPAEDGLWRRGDFATVELGGDVVAIRQRHSQPIRLPAFAVDFALGAEKFKPLGAHVEQYAALHHWDSLQTEALRKILPQLIQHGALISTAEICRLALADESPPPRPAQIEMLGVATGGDRSELLGRCLHSFGENLQRHGRGAALLVSDNSRSQTMAARAQATLASIGASLGLKTLFAAEPEKRAFAEALIRRGACSPEAIEFALFDPLGAGFSCGANRNALLLQGAGQMLACLDDDVTAALIRPPGGTADRTGFFSQTDPYDRHLYGHQAAAEAELAGAEIETDYLGAHELLLGRRLAEVLPPAEEIEFHLAGSGLADRLRSGPATIRATFAGHYGDPGIPTSHYYLYYTGANRERLCGSEAHFRAVLTSRQVLACAKTRLIGDGSVSPGMAMALDHRFLLPPFFPVLHAEDFSFGGALAALDRTAFFGHLPWAVAHRPRGGNAILTPSELRAAPCIIMEFAHLLRRLIVQPQLPEREECAAGMRFLGRQFVEFGELPAREFHELLRWQALNEASDRSDFLTRQLEEFDEAPDYWIADVEGAIGQYREAVETEDFEIPLDLRGRRSPEETHRFMQRLIGRYGRLLTEWPDIVNCAQALLEERPLFVGAPTDA